VDGLAGHRGAAA